jgi:hypothetical protein
MRNRAAVLLSLTALVLAGLSCGLFTSEIGLSNLRTAFDEDGISPTNIFSRTDEFFAVGDLENAPAGTVVSADWRAVSIEGYTPDELIYHQEINDFSDDMFTGTIFFQLSNDDDWLVGDYKVDISLNGNSVGILLFSVR